jgi:hypothetical protein
MLNHTNWWERVNWPVVGTNYVAAEWKEGNYGDPDLFPQLYKRKPRKGWLKRHSGAPKKRVRGPNKNMRTTLVKPEGPR